MDLYPLQVFLTLVSTPYVSTTTLLDACFFMSSCYPLTTLYNYHHRHFFSSKWGQEHKDPSKLTKFTIECQLRTSTLTISVESWSRKYWTREGLTINPKRPSSRQETIILIMQFKILLPNRNPLDCITSQSRKFYEYVQNKLKMIELLQGLYHQHFPKLMKPCVGIFSLL